MEMRLETKAHHISKINQHLVKVKNLSIQPQTMCFRPGLHESQLQVERSVTFLHSLVVERCYCLGACSGIAQLQ